MDKIDTNEQKKLQSAIVRLSNKGMKIEVKDNETHQLACNILVEVKGRKKKVDELIGPAKDASYKAYQEVSKLFKMAMEPLEKVEKALKPQIAAYSAKLEADQAEKQRKAEEEARKQLEKEREAQAKALEERGEKEAADHLRDAPIADVKVKVESAPETKGVFTKSNWKAEVVNLKALAKGVADGTVAEDCIQANMVTLNRLAKALKSNMNIPGVTAREEKVVAARSK